jgi:hypothetical protein
MAKSGPQEMAEICEGGDPYKVLKDAYEYGRALPYGRNRHDYEPPAQEPSRSVRAPDWDEYRANFRELKASPVSRPVDESGPTFRDSKAAHYNDCGNTWVRGMSNQSPHPAFDSGPSGFTYDRRRK